MKTKEQTESEILDLMIAINRNQILVACYPYFAELATTENEVLWFKIKQLQE